MKRKRFARTAALLLLLAVLFSAVPAGAGGVDLSQMSSDEIAALLKQVTEEAVRRGIEKTAKLAKGSYVAGVDIPAGRYLFTCLAKGDDWGNLTVTADRGEGKLLLWNVVSAPEEGEEPDTVFLILNEGDLLECDVPFSLTITAGIVFR